MMLRLISDCFSHIPIYALVDSDPHGVEIYLVYKFGSLVSVPQVNKGYMPEGSLVNKICATVCQSSSQKLFLQSQSHDVENLAVPKIEWLGVKPSDLLQLILPRQVFLPMSTRDRAKVQDMSQRKYMATQHQNLQEVSSDNQLHDSTISFFGIVIHFSQLLQLSLMLEKGKKVEIQSLDSISRNFLTEVYLPEKLKRLQIQTG